MEKRWFIVLALSVACLVWAAKEQQVDQYGGKSALWLDKGLYVGGLGNPNNPTGDKLNKISAFRTCNPTIDIGNAAAATTVVATGSCPGAAVGDVIVGIAPAADDAAFDEGVLSGFIESANTVKLQFHPDATGGDIASMVYYITYIKRTP